MLHVIKNQDGSHSPAKRDESNRIPIETRSKRPILLFLLGEVLIGVKYYRILGGPAEPGTAEVMLRVIDFSNGEIYIIS